MFLILYLLQISWIRLSDYRILTNGLITFTADDRFTVLHLPGGNEWTLQISGVQARDQGEYQCQAATTTGIRTISSWLTVTQPRASILGSREKHVNLGHSVTISCELRDSVGTPEFVFWYHNSTMVNFLPGVSVSTHLLGPDPDALWVAPPNTMVSTLLITSTKPEHAGNYTCAPPHSSSDSVRLYVSSGIIGDNNITTVYNIYFRLRSSTAAGGADTHCVQGGQEVLHHGQQQDILLHHLSYHLHYTENKRKVM